ncbi:hypothetical protein FRC03_003190 [Tulasnella sp. 419]|nr:hypothetical protein FRC03_003190 [Tulasnella sp. 419]
MSQNIPLKLLRKGKYIGLGAARRINSFWSSAKPPHQCLLIPELLLHIFEFLSRRDIQAASLVCRTWHPWAISTFWRVGSFTWTQLLAILRLKYCCLYQDPRCIEATIYGFKIPKGVALAEWKRFLFAFSHIKHLDIVYFNGIDETTSALLSLRKRFGGELIPNFQRISIGPHVDINQGAFSQLLFSNNLTSVDMVESCRHYPCQQTNQVDQWRRTSAMLTHFTLDTPHLRHMNISATFTPDFSLDSFQNLTSLRIEGEISAKTLASAFKCTDLQLLSLISCVILDHSANFWWDHPVIVHNALQELEVLFECDSVGGINNVFIWRIQLPALSRLSIVHWVEYDNMIALLEHTLSTSPKLTEVSLHGHTSVSTPLLSCISAFSSLKVLTITEALSTADIIGDMELMMWLQEMPTLEVLEWQAPYHHDPCHLMQLRHFLVFATYGSSLRKLSLSLDVSDLSVQTEDLADEYGDILSASRHYFPALRSLKLMVFNLTSSELHLLARLLTSLTHDDMELFVHLGVPNEEYVSQCQVIDRQLPLLIKLLREERRLLMNNTQDTIKNKDH